jgi:hypothetical protein
LKILKYIATQNKQHYIVFKYCMPLNYESVNSPFQQNVGILKLVEHENVVWRRISNGDRRLVEFYLYFPLSWPLPVLRSITSNGNVICIDNTSRTYLYLTNEQPNSRLCIPVLLSNIIVLSLLVPLPFLQRATCLWPALSLQLITVL